MESQVKVNKTHLKGGFSNMVVAVVQLVQHTRLPCLLLFSTACYGKHHNWIQVKRVSRWEEQVCIILLLSPRSDAHIVERVPRETVHCGVLQFQEVQRLYAGGQSGIRY